MDVISILPAECISHIVSYTTPRDACRSSLVSRLFRIAVDSDIVWERFLPQEYKEIIPASLNSLSKKDLYFHLCNHPIIIGNGNMSLALEKQSGKKCYMVGARGLSVIWGDASQYWQWKSRPESRFSQVAELNYVWWLDIKGYIETKNLSPGTTYAAYFVYQLSSLDNPGTAATAVTLRVGYELSAVAVEHSVVLDPVNARYRGDGWFEIEMGEFVTEEDNATVVCSLMETSNYNIKSGLIVEGIELRPQEVTGGSGSEIALPFLIL